MTIHIGADPNWYSGEQIAQDRAWGEVLQALTERRRREDEDAKMAGQLISQFPDPGLMAEMSQKYGDNASFRMAVEAAKRRSGLNEKFFTGVSRGQQDYRDAVHDYGQAEAQVPAYDALPMLGPMAGAMAQQAAGGMGREILNMDPSGVETGFQGLSPGEQAQFVPYAHDAYGLGIDRMLPERPGYNALSDPRGMLLYSERTGIGGPLRDAAEMGLGMIPRPGVMAEQAASLQGRTAADIANDERTRQREIDLEGIRQGNREDLVSKRAALVGGGKKGGLTAKQNLDSATDVILRSAPVAELPKDYGEDDIVKKTFDYNQKVSGQQNKLTAKTVARAAINAGQDPEVVAEGIRRLQKQKGLSFEAAAEKVLTLLNQSHEQLP